VRTEPKAAGLEDFSRRPAPAPGRLNIVAFQPAGVILTTDVADVLEDGVKKVSFDVRAPVCEPRESGAESLDDARR
jgi:hypothetical protein